jgi:hypothetical protein
MRDGIEGLMADKDILKILKTEEAIAKMKVKCKNDARKVHEEFDRLADILTKSFERFADRLKEKVNGK